MSGGARLALAGAALLLLAVLATLTSEPRRGRSGARRPPADPNPNVAKVKVGIPGMRLPQFTQPKDKQ